MSSKPNIKRHIKPRIKAKSMKKVMFCDKIETNGTFYESENESQRELV